MADQTNGGSHTRREADEPDVRTRREHQGPATRRDGNRTWTRISLPPELADEFTIVRELGWGGEGNVLLVEDAAGKPFVVKLYFPNQTFDDVATALLTRASERHVVKIHREGITEHDGSRFEVLEWYERGTLRDLLDAGVTLDIERVVAELSAAIEHIHGLRLDDDRGARLLHRDLKPDNVFVRKLEPLELVLGDFGLARIIAASRHYTARQQGSRPYAPPSGEAITPSWDWWSLGMIVVEVAGGRHPFRVDGAWLPDHVISDLLSQGPVDLSAVKDERVRLLCRGLLTRRTADRWGAEEVRSWLEGRDVKVAPEPQVHGLRPRSVVFNGVEYDDPTELALALQSEWDQALEQLIQRADGGNLSQQTSLFLASHRLTAAERLLQETSNPATRLANLLVEMNPALTPVYRGRDIRPAVLAAQITDPDRARDVVDLIQRRGDGLLHVGVLSSWRHLDGMEEGPALEVRLRAAKAFLDAQHEVLEQLPGKVVDHVRAAVYATALNPDAEDAYWRQIAQLDVARARRQQWWADLEDLESPYAPALACLCASVAIEESLREEEAAAAAAREREEAAAAARARAEAQRNERRMARQRLDSPWPAVAVLYYASLVALFRYLVDKPLDFGFEFDANLWPERHWWLPSTLVPYAAIGLAGSLCCLVTVRAARRRRRALSAPVELLVNLAMAALSAGVVLSVFAIAAIVAHQRTDAEPEWWVIPNLSVIGYGLAVPVGAVLVLSHLWRCLVVLFGRRT